MIRLQRHFRPTRATLAMIVALSTASAVPATAGARATVKVPGKCYVYWPNQGAQTIPISLSGLTPGTMVKVELQVDGTTVSGLPSITVDLTGSIETELRNWTSGLGDGPTQATPSKIVISDFTLGTEIASTPIDIANVGLDIDASRKTHGTKRRWIVSGLNQLGGARTYYAFYFKGSKLMGRQKIGAPRDDCGYMRTKQVLIPFQKVGTYAMKVQASKSYNKDLPWIGGTVRQR